MSFTNNTRDEVTLILLKNLHAEIAGIIRNKSASWDTKLILVAANHAIWNTFVQERERNSRNIQAGSYEAIAEVCDEFFAAAEPALVG